MGRTMRKWLAVGVLALVAACGGGMGAPSSPDGTGGGGAVVSGTGGGGAGGATGQTDDCHPNPCPGGTVCRIILTIEPAHTCDLLGTGGAVGTGGSTRVQGTGGAPAGGSGGSSSAGTGGAMVSYPSCAGIGVTTASWSQFSVYESPTKSQWGYVGSFACASCSPFPPGTPNCTSFDGLGLCVQSNADCTSWVEGSSGMPPR